MAEPFEQRLYALIERHQHCSPEALENFRALGDDAFVVGDLGGEHQIGFYLDDVQRLLKSYGVEPPIEQKASPFWWLWPDKCLVYRDFTIGELKALIRTGIWPDDAYEWEEVSLGQKLASLSVMLVLLVLVLGLLGLGVWWIAHWIG
ncbi:hypothetical protein [Asticcacaulis sp. EMRT-3]|uniref:hypothetical protein n=1 Tax=Asticcacaulis sp. EMRT-3 TaxID=3040349 RepID=UPI0024AFF59F|nr:hypothetical protein [Asticcacaulis sp. EMRT-3]MDI7774200.1 hypothetical protein [Asticcacaulis sp. EMRT-3]